MEHTVRFDRLRRDIEELGRIGRTTGGGLSRPSFSRADLEARDWLKERILAAGLILRQDGAGNIFGRLDGPGKTVMAGSHIDTVLNAGMFDGSVGVLAGLECLHRIKEENIALAQALEVVSFTDEEGNLVGDFLGSRAFIGRLNEEDIRRGQTLLGPPLGDILEGSGLTVESILGAHRERPEIKAFIELHIEQGPVLETEGVPIGVVDRIAGKHYRLCSFAGKASHAGTTPLELRQDAFLGLADFALRATQHVATQHYGSMVTIGKVNVTPGSFSIVPERADFTLEFRSTSKETLQALEAELFALAEDIAGTRGLGFVSKVVDATDPVVIPEHIVGLIGEECRKLGSSFMTLPSGAGHDAQILASVTETGMIFIPSIDGISHSPREAVDWEDIEKGANLLLRVLLRLSAEPIP